ncbi:MAG TPA: methyltransferase domain-containing protein [Pirellulales bacterium]|nr:methyltransferase domain-containing protein [Pirellulales bacterium]
MSTSPTYFANDNVEALEQERLACLGELLNRTTEHRLAQLPIAAGWKCLEIGAGEGYVARVLAARVGAAGRVVATDINPRFLSGNELANVEVRRHDILHDELETGHYDLVHCRMLLMHLPDPASAVRRMTEALRPGGWLMIEEGDMISLGPADASHRRSANFARVTRAISDAVTATKLIDSYFGRRVRSLVEQFGFADVEHEGRVPVSRGGERGARFFQLSSELVGPKLIAAGVLDRDQFADHHAAYDDPTFTFVGMTNFAAWGRKAPHAR